MMRVPAINLLFLFVFGCTFLDARFENSVDAKHPAVLKFLAYEKAVHKVEQFDAIYRKYFAAADWPKIEKLMGWPRLVYSSSFKALKSGRCDSLNLDLSGGNTAVIYCKGIYRRANMLAGADEFPMELKVYMKRSGEQWFVSRSGLKYGSASSGESGFGLKF